MTMLDDLVPIVMFLSIAYAVVGVTKVIADGRTRRRLIEAGATRELAEAITAPPRGDPQLYSSLKWGIVIAAVGLALITVQFLPYSPDDPVAFGLILLFGAAGLLVYYGIARRQTGG
jgi:phosphatidylglycerophosphate synthase